MENGEVVLGIRKGSRVQDRYLIRGLLGRGGFGAVFRAYDERMERDVAVKVLNLMALLAQGNEQEVMLSRFRREAKLAARIAHRCVVQIFDYGVLDEETENPFIIMEVLDGHDLEVEIEREGPLDPVVYLPLFVDCLEALGDAHKIGIVHKDLKPSNIFVSEPGTRRSMLKLVDFGIAHLGESNESRLTQTGFILGSPQYMAPEYVEAQSVSPALDVYQMGLILVEMLAGQAVVEGETSWKNSLMHVAGELSVPLALLRSDLGPVIRRALAREPQDRFENASDFCEALAAVDPASIARLEPGAERRLLNEQIVMELSGSDTPAVEDLPVDDPEATQMAQLPVARGGFFASMEDFDKKGNIGAGFGEHASREESDGDETQRQAVGAKASSKQAVIALIICVAVLVAGIGGYRLWQSSPEQESPEQADDEFALSASGAFEADPLSLPPQGVVSAPEAPDESPAHLAEGEEMEEIAAPQEIEVAIVVVPETARIEADGVEIGRGSGELIFVEGDQESVELRVTHDGYHAVEHLVTSEMAPKLNIELERIRRAAPRQAPRQVTRPVETGRAPEPEPEPEAPAEEEEQNFFLVAP